MAKAGEVWQAGDCCSGGTGFQPVQVKADQPEHMGRAAAMHGGHGPPYSSIGNDREFPSPEMRIARAGRREDPYGRAERGAAGV
jgi:hypothetical protein